MSDERRDTGHPMPNDVSESVPELPAGITPPFHSDFEPLGPLNRRWYIADVNGKEYKPSASLLNAVFADGGLRAQLTRLQAERDDAVGLLEWMYRRNYDTLGDEWVCKDRSCGIDDICQQCEKSEADTKAFLARIRAGAASEENKNPKESNHG